MNTTPIPNSGGAVDLDQVARANAEEIVARDAEERQQARAHIEEHDRRMQRIFKGIISRPQRRKLMTEALERMARGYVAPPRQDPNNPKGGIHTRADNPRKRRGPGGGGKRKDGPRR